LNGCPPWQDGPTSPGGPPIHIAYRRDRIFSYYDMEYKPKGKLTGHYWGIVRLCDVTALAHAHAPLLTQNYFQPLADSTNTMELGNYWKSGPHRH
jgi:hypothetical protein